MQNPYTLSCYILICNQLRLIYFTMSLYCKLPDKAVLERSLTP